MSAPAASAAAAAASASAGTPGEGSYPDLTSPTDSVIAGDFGAMSAEEQERQRDEWKAELAKTEEEIATLRQVTTVPKNICNIYLLYVCKGAQRQS